MPSGARFVRRLATAQEAILGPHASLLKHSAASLPNHIRGVVFANELLDALPTHAVVMTEAGLREVFVDERNGQFVEHLHERLRPLRIKKTFCHDF